MIHHIQDAIAARCRCQTLIVHTHTDRDNCGRITICPCVSLCGCVPMPVIYDTFSGRAYRSVTQSTKPACMLKNEQNTVQCTLCYMLPRMASAISSRGPLGVTDGLYGIRFGVMGVGSAVQQLIGPLMSCARL